MNDSLINATNKSLVFVNELATNIVVGIIIFLVGLIIARILSKLVQKVLRDFSIDGTLRKKTGIKTSFEKFITSSIFIIVTLIFLVIALNYVGVTNLIVDILSIAIIIVVTVSLLLAIKDNIPNLLAYRAIRLKKTVEEGDVINIENATGTVEEISVFQVRIRKGEDIIYIPNSLFLKKEFSRKKRKTSRQKVKENK